MKGNELYMIKFYIVSQKNGKDFRGINNTGEIELWRPETQISKVDDEWIK